MQHLRLFCRSYRLLAALALLAMPLAGWAQSSSGEQPGASSSSLEAMPPAPPQDAEAASSIAVRLSDVEGTVRISDSKGKLFDQALQNMAVLPGMSLETGSDGRVELEFPDGSVARVTPNSKLALSSLTQGGDQRVHLTLTPLKGLTYYELAPGGSSFAVQVGPLTAHNLHTNDPALLRVNLDAAPYQAAAMQGTVHFEDASGNAAYDLEANQTARIDPAVPTNYDIVMELTPDSWDSWNADRRDARAEIAQATSSSGENNGPGWNDLNYYGSWYNVPGEGVAWAPDGVGADFDPYGSGAWGYYTNAGYGWVSSYPWGWLPYHCGLWDHHASYGWMWRPAHCGWGQGYGWYPYTEVRNAPFHYRGPLRPLPPRGISHGPRVQAVIPVQQASAAHFRVLGEPRPASRSLVVSGVPVQPMPVEARPSYRTAVPASGFREVQGGRSFVQPGQPGYAAGARVIGPAPTYIPQTPRVLQAPRNAIIAPAPMPAPRMSPPPAISAPHVSAPASPPGRAH